MKSILNLFLIVIVISGQLYSQDFTIMTYNIRYDNHWDTINSWEKRKESVYKIIEESGADIFGVQEALHNQIIDLQSAFPDFEYVGAGRDDGKTKGEYTAIFYRKDKFELLDQSTFWLSETPEEPSVGWDASMERICTYVCLRDKKINKGFWVFNAHYDHVGVEARKKSSVLILNKIEEITDPIDPVVLLGDLNAEAQEESIMEIGKKFVDMSFSSSDARVYKLGTFNGFQKGFEAKKIDYIFIRNVFGKNYYQVFDTMSNGHYPSDHFPVVLGIEFK